MYLPRSPRSTDCHQNWRGLSRRGRKFQLDRFRSFRAPDGRKSLSPIDLRHHPYNSYALPCYTVIATSAGTCHFQSVFAKRLYFYFRSKMRRNHRVRRPRFIIWCSNFGDSAINMAKLHIFYCACAKQPYFYFLSKIWRHHRVPNPDFLHSAEILAIRENVRQILRFSYLHRFSGPLGQKWRFLGVNKKYVLWNTVSVP